MFHLRANTGLGTVAQTSTLGGGDGWIMSSRDRDHPGQQGETLSLQEKKKKKLAKRGVACL